MHIRTYTVNGVILSLCLHLCGVCVCVCICACVHCVMVPACLCHPDLLQVQDMYFANPPVAPNLVFYKEVFHSLVKFDDR